MVENCPIVIGERTLPMKLEVFSMLGFAVILEWIDYQRYRADIDFRK
jgi:hypothetical protein